MYEIVIFVSKKIDKKKVVHMGATFLKKLSNLFCLGKFNVKGNGYIRPHYSAAGFGK